MLTQFQIKKTFYHIHVTLYVDCERKEAELLIKENRLLRRTDSVRFDDVRDPAKAEAYLGRQIPAADGTLGFMEYLHWASRRGIAPFERAA